MIDYKDILKTLGNNLRAERKRKQLSQEKLAEIANVHTNYVGKVERGEQNITIKKLIGFANSLDIESSQLFFGFCKK